MFEKPLHPYTRTLIESILKIRDTEMKKGLSGRPPDLRSPPGCRFHPKCPFAMDICRTRRSPLIEVSKQHYVSCWLYEKK